MDKFELKAKQKNGQDWVKMVKKMRLAKKKINIGIVGKYFATGDFCLSDSYISVIEAIKHASYAQGIKPEISWINTSEIEKNGIKSLKK